MFNLQEYINRARGLDLISSFGISILCVSGTLRWFLWYLRRGTRHGIEYACFETVYVVQNWMGSELVNGWKVDIWGFFSFFGPCFKRKTIGIHMLVIWHPDFETVPGHFNICLLYVHHHIIWQCNLPYKLEKYIFKSRNIRLRKDMNI